MNDAKGLQRSRAGYFKLGRTGGRPSRGRWVNGRRWGNAAGPWASGTCTGKAVRSHVALTGVRLDSEVTAAGGVRGPHSVPGLFTSPSGSWCSSVGRVARGHLCRRSGRGRLWPTTSTRPLAGSEPAQREVRGSTLGVGTPRLTDWESGRAGTGRGPNKDSRPSSPGRKAWGRPCGGGRGRGSLGQCGDSSLPGRWPTGSRCSGRRGTQCGPRP